MISQYDYTYDDRGFIVAEDAVESLYGYAWDDKHDGKHENWHDDKYPHGDKHINKHDKDGVYNFQIIGTKRTFEYDEDGKLTKAVEDEDRQGQYIYLFEYDDMGNRTYYEKSRNGTVQERARCTYNAANQLVQAEIYNGKKTTTLNYGYDGDGNRITETGKIGTDKVELTYTYTVENRLKAVHDADELLAAMAYDGDGNGNNKDNSGSGSSGTFTAAETGSEDAGLLASMVSFFTGDEEDDAAESVNAASETEETEDETEEETDNGVINGNKNHDKGNNGNAANNGVGNGNGNSGNNGNGNGNSGSDDSEDTGTGGTADNNGNAAGNTTNTDESTNQSSILFPIDGEVSELEQELIDLIKTTGKQKNYELVEYVNDVNREHTEVLMELNINGIMDTAYSYGNERLTNERFTGWTGYYTYDPRGSVGGVTDSEGMIWQSYRYDAYGNITFGKPQYNNVYSYNAESYNPNMDVQYLRARYYCPTTANFMTEDTYLGDITDPLTLNRYNYVKSSPLNYVDPSGHDAIIINRTMATGDTLEEIGIEHMGALFQNENQEWYYFFWGQSGADYVKMGVNSQKGEVFQGFENLDAINKHFEDPNNPGYPNIYGTKHPFDASVYIKGDFSDVHKKIEENVKKAKENMKAGKCENSSYNFFTNNCSQVTMSYILEGILPGTDQSGNPLTVGAYYYGELGFSVSVIPNINMHNMQYAFGNTATNSEDFKSSISGKYISNVYNSEGDEIN